MEEKNDKSPPFGNIYVDWMRTWFDGPLELKKIDDEGSFQSSTKQIMN